MRTLPKLYELFQWEGGKALERLIIPQRQKDQSCKLIRTDKEDLLMKNRTCRWIALTLTLILALGCFGTASAEMDKLTVVLNFTIQGDHSPWFVAKAKGYFAEQNIDIDIQRGYGSGDTVQKVATGNADLGFADIVPMIMSVAQGAEVKAVMGGIMNEPSALYSAAEDANILTPFDMEGKSIGGPPADVSIVLLEAVMKKAGADFSKVNIINMDAATRLPMLATGQIDSAASFYEKTVLFDKGLKEAGKTLVTWRFDEFINKYSCVVLAGNDMIENNPELLQRAMLALLKGYEDALQMPDFGAQYILDAHPEFDPDYIKASAATLPDAVWDETSLEKGLGIFSPEKIQETLDIAAEYWTLERTVLPEEIYTNEFMEWAHAHK